MLLLIILFSLSITEHLFRAKPSFKEIQSFGLSSSMVCSRTIVEIYSALDFLRGKLKLFIQLWQKLCMMSFYLAQAFYTAEWFWLWQTRSRPHISCLLLEPSIWDPFVVAPSKGNVVDVLDWSAPESNTKAILSKFFSDLFLNLKFLRGHSAWVNYCSLFVLLHKLANSICRVSIRN